MAGLLDDQWDLPAGTGGDASASPVWGDQWDPGSLPKEEPGFLDRIFSKDTWTPPEDGSPGFVEKLGLALGGGLDTTGMSKAQQATAGRRALLQFGLTMLANNGYSPVKQSLGQAVGLGLGAAGNSLIQTEKLASTRASQDSLSLLRRMQLLTGMQTLADKRREAERDAAARDQIRREQEGERGGGGRGAALPPMGTGGPGAAAVMPAEWQAHFEEASKETGIPVDLLIAQARQESGFRPDATGAAGEIGVMQIKPDTAANPGHGLTGVDPATLRDPRQNILFGARYLKARGGATADWTSPKDQAAALTAYNGGGDPNYVQNVFRYRPAAPAAAPGGVAARTGGTDVAGPPGTVPGPGGAPGGAGAVAPAAAPAPAAPAAAAPGGGAATAPAAPPAIVPNPVRVPPPDMADIKQERADIEATYRQERSAAVNSKDPAAAYATAAEKRREAHRQADQKAAERTLKQGEEQRKLDAEWTAKQAELAAKREDVIRQNAEAERVRLAKVAEDQAKEDRDRAAAIEAARVAHERAIQSSRLTSDLEEGRTAVKELRAQHATARGVADVLEQMGEVEHSLDPTAAPLTARYGWLNDMWQAIGAGTPEQKKEIIAAQQLDRLRQQAGTVLRVHGDSQFSNQDAARVDAMTASLAAGHESRVLAIANMKSLMDRKMQEANYREGLIRLHGVGLIPGEGGEMMTAQEAVDKKFGSLYKESMPDAPQTPEELQKNQYFIRQQDRMKPFYAWAPGPSGGLTKRLMVRDQNGAVLTY